MSDLARVYPGAGLAVTSSNLGLPEKSGAEKSAPRPSGKEWALGGQDLAK